MSELEYISLICCAVLLIIALLIIVFLLYQDRKHWRMRCIEAETMQGLLTEEVMYLRSRPIKPDLHVVRGTNEKP